MMNGMNGTMMAGGGMPSTKPAGLAAPQRPAQAPAQARQPGGAPVTASNFVNGLKRLTPEEIDRLDQLITPELAALIAKAFPSLAGIFNQFAANDGQDGTMPTMSSGGGGMGMMGGDRGTIPMARPASALGRIGR